MRLRILSVIVLLACAACEDPDCGSDLRFDPDMELCVCDPPGEWDPEAGICQVTDGGFAPDAGPDACVAVAESCNGRDDDCDRIIDEGAASSCDAAPQSSATCAVGSCGYECLPAFGDCDGEQANGCEDDLATPARCGACDVSCGWSCQTRMCDDPITIASGHAHSCAATRTGRVYCWGDNGSGRLGTGSEDAVVLAPRVVLDTDGVLPLRDVVEVTASDGFTCARVRNGSVYCWGENQHGTLGDGSTTDSSHPVRVRGLPLPAVQISAGRQHVCAVLEDQSAMCWGSNEYGQLGDGRTIDRTNPSARVSGLTAIRQLSAGYNMTCAVLSDDMLRCWGGGALGRGSLSEISSTPVAVESGIRQVSVGRNLTTCAITVAGGAVCWGWNGSGQIGDGTTTNRASPTAVADFVGGVEVSVGAAHVCARTSESGVYCWGDNGSGQLGDDTVVNRTSPVPPLEPQPMSALSAGYSQTCAIRADDSLVCWGAGGSGQLGDGERFQRSAPVQVLAPVGT